MSWLMSGPTVLREQEARMEEMVRREVQRQLQNFRRKTTIVAFSGQMDRLGAALSLASASAACGLETTMFFTFWGLAALRKPDGQRQKSWRERVLSGLLPTGCARMPVSSMNFGGAGAMALRWLMRSKGVPSPAEVLDDARTLGVRLVACQMSLEMLGLTVDELLDGVEVGGAAAFMKDAADSTVTLFI